MVWREGLYWVVLLAGLLCRLVGGSVLCGLVGWSVVDR